QMVDDTMKLPSYRGQPILFNEDDHFDFDKPQNNMLAALRAYASWGYFAYRMAGEPFDDGYQSVPVNWTITSPLTREFVVLVSKVTGIGSPYPFQSGEWRDLPYRPFPSAAHHLGCGNWRIAMKWPISVSCAATLAWAMSYLALAASAPCEGLSSVSLPHATITAARTVAAGAFTPPGDGGNGEGLKKLPSFCRIAATLRPSADSDIKIEVWLPVSGWNGKFQAVGNGGWAGTISYPAMSRALEHGYATSSPDPGHPRRSAR